MNFKTALILTVCLAGGCATKGVGPEGTDTGATQEEARTARIKKRDKLAEMTSGRVGELRRIIEMSDDWWVVGEQNRAHGDVLLSLKDKYPEAFDSGIDRARARESALVLMEAAETGAEFTETPGVIFLERAAGEVSEGGYTIDLGEP